MTAYNNLSKEQLVAEIKRLKKSKKFGLLWEDKPEDVAELCKTKLPVLVDVEDKAISDGPHDPTNIIIEGDNYHALSVLNYTHKGKIDVIYIDPPYNTGNDEGFIYNDKIVDKEDGFKHSKWISFMGKRLRLAKNLLKTNGFSPAQSSFDIGTKLTLVSKNNITIAVNYDLQLQEDLYGHYGYVEARYSF